MSVVTVINFPNAVFYFCNYYNKKSMEFKVAHYKLGTRCSSMAAAGFISHYLSGPLSYA